MTQFQQSFSHKDDEDHKELLPERLPIGLSGITVNISLWSSSSLWDMSKASLY